MRMIQNKKKKKINRPKVLSEIFYLFVFVCFCEVIVFQPIKNMTIQTFKLTQIHIRMWVAISVYWPMYAIQYELNCYFPHSKYNIYISEQKIRYDTIAPR